MPFNNPIAGGDFLVRPAIKSPNFVTGVSGWSINRDGTAEFSQLTARGGLIVTGGNEIDIIDAGGNTVIRISPTLGVSIFDALGNLLIRMDSAGFQVFDPTGLRRAILAQSGAFSQITLDTNHANRLAGAILAASTPTAGGSMQLTSPDVGKGFWNINAVAPDAAHVATFIPLLQVVTGFLTGAGILTPVNIDLCGDNAVPAQVVARDYLTGTGNGNGNNPTVGESIVHHQGTFDVTTAGDAKVTITHGAGFTPTGVIVINNRLDNFPPGVNWWSAITGTYTATTFRAQFRDNLGAAVVSSRVVGSFVAFK